MSPLDVDKLSLWKFAFYMEGFRKFNSVGDEQKPGHLSKDEQLEALKRFKEDHRLNS